MRAGVGLSRAPDASRAAHEATSEALAGLSGAVPGLAVVFTAAGHDLPRLAAAVQAAVGDAPVVGATSCGIFVSGTFVGDEHHVGVLVLAGDEIEFGVALDQGLGNDNAAAGRRVARAARAGLPTGPDLSAAPGGDAAPDGSARHSTVLLLSDGLAGDQQEIVRGVHAVAGARVPVIGGTAADAYTLSRTAVLCRGEAHRRAVVAVWMRSRRPLTITSGHGWSPAGLPALVTSAEGNRVRAIAGTSAQEFFVEQLRLLGEKRAGERFYELAVRHPLGLVQSDGSHLIRSVLAGDATGLLTSAGVPSGSSIQVMAGDAETLLSGADRVATQLRERAPEAAAFLYFSCAARRLALGARIAEEPDRLGGGPPSLGLYTYGEFCRSTSAQGFHNATITGIAL